jgi:hypothetical protein
VSSEEKGKRREEQQVKKGDSAKKTLRKMPLKEGNT